GTAVRRGPATGAPSWPSEGGVRQEGGRWWRRRRTAVDLGRACRASVRGRARTGGCPAPALYPLPPLLRRPPPLRKQRQLLQALGEQARHRHPEEADGARGGLGAAEEGARPEGDRAGVAGRGAQGLRA